MGLDPLIGDEDPFSCFYVAVLLSAWYGGLGPSILALVLGATAAFALILARGGDVASLLVGLILYGVVGSAMILVSEAHRRARRHLEREVAQRRRAERDSRESEGRFRQLAASIGDVFWLTDMREHRVLYVNPAYEAIWGRRREDLHADSSDWIAGIHPEDRPRVEAAFNDKALLGAYDEQFRVVRPDGTTRWVRDRGYPLKDDSGEVVRVAGIAEDITERLLSERKARRLKALSDRANDALLVLGPDGGILDANGVACEWLGYDRQRLLTLGMPDIDATLEVDRFRVLFDRALAGRVPPFEGLLKRRDGTTIPVEIGVVAEWFEGEAYLFAVVRDVAERKAAEAASRESERRLRQLANTMPQIVWTADADGAVVSFNGRWYEYTGMTAEESLAREGWRSAVHPDDLERLDATRLRAVGEGELFEAEVRLRRRDGTYRWHLIRSAPVRDEEGRLARRFGTATDLDERKRAEEAARRGGERLRLALEAGRMGTWDWDIPTGRIEWSDNLEEIHGLPPGGFDGTMEAFRRLIHPEDRGRVEEAVAAAVEAGAGFEAEFRILRPDGSVGWMAGKGRVHADESGNSVRMVGVGMDITPRKEAEAALRRAEDRFRVAQESSLDGFTILRAVRGEGGRIEDFEWEFANPAAARMLRSTPEELVGRRLLDLLPGNRDRSELFGLYVKVVETGQPHDIELHDQGEGIDGWFRNMAVRLGDGLAVSFCDITQRRAMEEALRASEAQYRAVYDQATAGIAEVDLDGRFLRANDRYCAIVGYPREELLGMHFREITHPDDPPANLDRFARVPEGPSGDTIEQRHVRKDGQTVWCRAAVSLIRDAGGQAERVVAVVEDITERKRAEERLRLLWEAAAVLLSTGEPDAMIRGLFSKLAPHFGLDLYFNYMLDEAGQALRLESCVGIPEAEARSIARLELGQAVCGTVARTLRPIMATDIQHSDDPKVQLVKSFGVRAYACTPLLAGEALLGTLSFASRSRDRFDEDEIEFFGTVCRYVAAAYERLRLIGRLREADRRKDEFLATLAHELRTPLAPIRHAVALLRKLGPPDPEMQAYRDVIDRQVGHMAVLLEDLLDVSRITRDTLRLRRERVDLASVARVALETSRPLIESGAHEVFVSLPDEPVVLDADPTRLAQVLSNLLNNAAKYSDRGGTIALAAERRDGRVSVSVKDTGIGIESEHLSHIFEMFSQVTPAMERSQGGLGIGLSLVRGLVELHGGSVEARSEGPGTGSEFIVHLPVAAASPSAQPSGPPAERNGARRPGHPARILLVDDSVDSARTLGWLLKLAGHEVQLAHSGPAGLEAAERFRPEVAVLDLGLPGFDGFELARRLRRRPGGDGLILIALTGWGQERDRLRTREAGFDHHLVKPVDSDALVDLLRSPVPWETRPPGGPERLPASASPETA
jgi:PAS domain S-box-containing protein